MTFSRVLAMVMMAGLVGIGAEAKEKVAKEEVRIQLEGVIQKGEQVEKFKEEYDDARDAVRDLQKKLKRLGLKSGLQNPRWDLRGLPPMQMAPPQEDGEIEQDDRPQRDGQNWTWRFPAPDGDWMRRFEAPVKPSNQPWMGIQMQELNEDLRSVLNVKEGVVVTQVMENSPAMKAGLKAGDVVTQVDKTMVDEPGELRQEILDHKIGEKVVLTMVRDGKILTLNVQLARHGEAEPPTAITNGLGLRVAVVKDHLEVTEVEEEGPAHEAGLRVGDRLLKMQGKSVVDVKGFESLAQELKGKKVLVLIERDGQRSFIVVK